MAAGREYLKGRVVEAIQANGGRAAILIICKYVWDNYKQEIEDLGDLKYVWQYEIRWAGTLLRKEGVIRSADISPRGIWELEGE